MQVIVERARELDAPLSVCGRDFEPAAATAVPLRGPHQRENAGVARALISTLPAPFEVSSTDIALGLASVRWPGRFDTVASDPAVILDGAHNPQAVAALIQALDSTEVAGPCVLVFGVMADKDWQAMLRLLADHVDHVVAVPVDQARALDPQLSCDFMSSYCSCTVADSVEQGLNEASARAGTGGSVVVTGSIFLVGEAYQASGWLPESVDAAIER
jgi:dihydrofolate synthase/folylpolyglutamate synthase